MDWLLPARAATEAIVAFELLLDRVVAESGATLVSAYRCTSFDTDAVVAALCVHPQDFRQDMPPPFRLVAQSSEAWRLSGDIDLGDGPTFVAAFTAAVRTGPQELDVSDLGFIMSRASAPSR